MSKSQLIFEKATDEKTIHKILLAMDNTFTPTLTSSIENLSNYAKSLASNAEVYYVKINEEIVGYVAFYANNLKERISFITQIAVKKEKQSMGIGKKLIEIAELKSRENDMATIELEVYLENLSAIKFYKKSGYQTIKSIKEGQSILMSKKL